jgi:hypothetical protein
MKCKTWNCNQILRGQREKVRGICSNCKKENTIETIKTRKPKTKYTHVKKTKTKYVHGNWHLLNPSNDVKLAILNYVR